MLIEHRQTADDGNERIILDPAKDELVGISGISFGRYRTNWSALPLHAHDDCMEMSLCVRGALVYECEGKRYDILPNNVFVVQPQESHHLTTTHKGMRIYWLSFRYPRRGESVLGLTAVESATLARRLRRVSVHVFAVSDEMRDLFRRVFDTARNSPRGAFRTLTLRTLVVRILLLIIESADNRPSLKAFAKISRIARALSMRPAHRFALADLARHTGLSESRFTALFRQVVGLPPYAYQANCRLSEVKRRLAETEDTVREIACSLGYASAQHLATQFRKSFGVTPTTFRQVALQSKCSRAT